MFLQKSACFKSQNMFQTLCYFVRPQRFWGLLSRPPAFPSFVSFLTGYSACELIVPTCKLCLLHYPLRQVILSLCREWQFGLNSSCLNIQSEHSRNLMCACVWLLKVSVTLVGVVIFFNLQQKIATLGVLKTSYFLATLALLSLYLKIFKSSVLKYSIQQLCFNKYIDFLVNIQFLCQGR